MSKATIVVSEGTHEDPSGETKTARMYSTEGDAPPLHTPIELDPSIFTSWEERDGSIGIIRRTSSVSVGASAAYSRAYDSIDWGN